MGAKEKFKKSGNIYNNKTFFASIEGDDDLYITDVLFSYIYPQIFICENDEKDKFLLYEMSNENDIDTWLVTRVSDDDCDSLQNKKLSVQEVYRGKNDIFLLSKVYKENEDIVHISFDNLDFWMNKLPIKPVYAEG